MRPLPHRHLITRTYALMGPPGTSRRGDTLDLLHWFDWLHTAYATWGYPLVLLGALFENTVLLGLILPGGSLVLLGAVYAHDGTMSLPLVLILGWLGMIAGTSLDYALGRWGMHALLSRLGLLDRLRPRLDAAEQHLERRGVWTFLGAHFIGHVRSFVAITAGAAGLPYRRFLGLECIAALAWNAVFIGIGYLVGGNLETLQMVLSRGGLVVALSVALLYVGYHLIRRRRGRQVLETSPRLKT